MAAALTIREVLGSVFLTDLVENIKTGLPNFVPDEFYTTKEQVFGDAFRHIAVSGTRQVARQSLYGAPPRRYNLSGVSARDMKCIHIQEEISLGVTDFMNLHNYTSLQNQEMGKQEIRRQGEQFRTRFDNHLIGATTSVLNTGKIFYDGDGNMLPSSSGSVLTVDAGIPAANLNQCSGSLSASWATASTDIPGDILRLKDLALQTTGYGIEGGYALYGINIPKYFALNTEMQQFLYRSVGQTGLDYNNTYLTRGEIPDGFMGMKWRRMSGSFFNDQNDTKQTFWSGDQITFTPPVSKAWWAMLEGSHPVPKAYAPISTSLETAMENYEFKHGLSSYAYPQPPPGLAANIVYMNTFLPWLKINNVCWICSTVF